MPHILFLSLFKGGRRVFFLFCVEFLSELTGGEQWPVKKQLQHGG